MQNERDAVFIVVENYENGKQNNRCVCKTEKDAMAICRKLNKKYGTKEIIDDKGDIAIPVDYESDNKEVFFNIEFYRFVDSQDIQNFLRF